MLAGCHSALDLDEYTFAAGAGGGTGGAGGSAYGGSTGSYYSVDNMTAAGSVSSNVSGMGGQVAGGSTGQAETPNPQATGGTAGAGSNAGGTSSTGASDVGYGPPATGGCINESEVDGIELDVLYTDRPVTSAISMVLAIQNSGSAFPLSDLVLRYWFTDDGLDVNIGQSDYASNNLTSAITFSFGVALGSNFADIGFSNPGDIGDGIEEIQVRLHTANYTSLDRTNDFSYSAESTAVINRNITAYVDGIKVFGCEPEP